MMIIKLASLGRAKYADYILTKLPFKVPPNAISPCQVECQCNDHGKSEFFMFFDKKST